MLNKNLNFNKNETKSKMENPTNIFRETSLVLQLIEESQIKSNKNGENNVLVFLQDGGDQMSGTFL